MLYNIKHLPLHCVFHGIRFKVKKIGCRDDNQFFFAQFLIGKKICQRLLDSGLFFVIINLYLSLQ